MKAHHRGGGPLSPLLSKHSVGRPDKELTKRGHKYTRYADDCNVYCRSKRAAERTYDSIVDFIEKRLKLKINRDKSKVDSAYRIRFLGYGYYACQKGKVSLRLGLGVASYSIF